MSASKTLPVIDEAYLISTLTNLLNTPSPTGFTDKAISLVENELAEYKNLTACRTRKGGLVIEWPGAKDDSPRALTAHLDTLGAVVKEIKSNGKLRLSALGGLNWFNVETEGVFVFTAGGKPIRGSLMFHKPSMHVFSKEELEAKRDDTNMEVRLDARTGSAAETRALGIEVGDFVAFDPRVEVTDGFIRSRFLDDKACVACLLAAVKSLQAGGLKPAQKTYIYFSNFEEVGHGGAAGIPADVTELVTVDMAAVGEGQNSDEFHATVCIKDSGSPYHHGLTNKLRSIAAGYQIDYRADVYPHYGSDGEAAWRAGADIAVALIGPGVDASHNYERTHIDALRDTTRWVMAYLLEE
jgi:putative aminopeptidase FrvX